MPRNKDIKKVLVIGSGPIVIGLAAEFDYAGTQACRSLKEEGVEVVLVNSNPATIMTDKEIADEVYIEPLTVDVLEKIIAKEPISVELIREIHRVLTSGTYDERRYVENGERPGEFKKHDYVTGIHEVGSPVETVAADMQELVDEINAYSGTQYLRVGAYRHARFESIHPFADGNGRVGRTLLNYYFMINNQPPLVVYNEDKGLYYACLNKYDEQEALDSLEEFLKYEVEKTWNKALTLAQSEEAPQHKPLTDFLPELQ